MPRISQTTRFEQVEHILGSGTGILDFAVKGENEYYTWEGSEDANWTVEDVDYVENDGEDRFILHPIDEYFTCDIKTNEKEKNIGSVQCWCE